MLDLIKKILKAELWKSKDKIGDDWIVIKKGLIIFFSIYQNKDTYSMFKKYVTSKTVREEMMSESDSIKKWVNSNK